MSKKQTTNTSQNTTSSLSTTPTNPAWVDQGLAGVGSQINNLSNMDPYSLIAGPDPLQTTAANSAGDLTGTPWNYAGATDVARGVANSQAPDIAALMSKFQNPYTDQVVNTSLADFDQNAGVTQAQNKLALAGDSTFGGSGGAIQTSMSNDALTRARATLDAQLRDQGYQTSLTGATAQGGLDSANQSQRLAAANSISNISDAQAATQRANIASQASLGDMLRQITQAKQQAPLTLAGAQAGLYGALPLNLLHGTDATGTGTMTGTNTSTESDPLGQLSKLLQAIGSLGGGGGGASSLAALGG